MPVKARPDTLAALTESDQAALKSIYCHRCLDETLLRQFFYRNQDNGQNHFTLSRIRWFIQQDLLGIDEYGGGKCSFYLTNRGLQTVRALFDEPMFVIDRKTGRRKYDVTCSTLRPAQNLLDHQIHLNALALDIEARCQLPAGCYKDSKFASNFTYAQPDGVFELPEFDIFLEMDMAHERKAKLAGKWTHYRNYRSAREYYLRRNKKTIILFATENIRRSFVQRRGKVIQSIMESSMDLLCPTFDCYIGPSSEMAEVAERIIKSEDSVFRQAGGFLQSQLQFHFSRPVSVKEQCGEEYLYMRLLDERRRTLVRDGRPQHFFLENYLDRPMSVLKRAICHSHTLSLLKDAPDIPLLLIVPDELSIYQDLRAAGEFGMKNIIFTTMKRLQSRIFPEALFQFDQMGNRFHFSDYSYSKEVHEKNAV